MLSRLFRGLRPRSVYDVMAAIACFGVLAGGTAYAANTIRSSDIVDGEVKTADVANQDLTGGDIKDGSLTTFDLADGAGVAGADVIDGTLGTADIGELHGSRLVNGSVNAAKLGTGAVTGIKVAANTLDDFNIQESTLFKCHNGTTLYGRICASANGSGNVSTALSTCGAIGLRLPTLGEAYLLARNYDVPGVDGTDAFWTDEVTNVFSEFIYAIVTDTPSFSDAGGSGNTEKIVCVETPTGLS